MSRRVSLQREDDADLVRLFQETRQEETRQEDARREEICRIFYERHAPTIGRFLASRGLAPELCAEVVQDVFLKIFNGLGGFRYETTFLGWCYTITRNTLRNKLRDLKAAKRDGVEVEVEESLLSGVDDPLTQVLCGERAQLLDRGVETLEPRDRRLVRYRLDQELKYREIARLEGIPEGTVKSRLSKIYRILRHTLEDLE